MAKPNILLRDFAPEDAAGLVACIREEYGASYFQPEFYRTDYLRELHAGGRTHFLVAESAGEIAAMLALHIDADCGTIATGIVRKAYRGAGVMPQLFRRAVEQAKRLHLRALFCRSVAYHDITQRRLEELGFSPTALLMAEFLTEGQYSYEKDTNLKHPHVLLVNVLLPDSLPCRIFVPAVCRDAAEMIYAALHRRAEISTACAALGKESALSVEYDDSQRCTSIFVHRAGADLRVRVREIERSRRADLQTANVFLNLADADAVAAYEVLRAMGYFFTGFFPLCKGEETMVLHNPMGVAIDAAAFALSPAAANLRDFVETRRFEGEAP